MDNHSVWPLDPQAQKGRGRLRARSQQSPADTRCPCAQAVPRVSPSARAVLPAIKKAAGGSQPLGGVATALPPVPAQEASVAGPG